MNRISNKVLIAALLALVLLAAWRMQHPGGKSGAAVISEQYSKALADESQAEAAAEFSRARPDVVHAFDQEIVSRLASLSADDRAALSGHFLDCMAKKWAERKDGVLDNAEIHGRYAAAANTLGASMAKFSKVVMKPDGAELSYDESVEIGTWSVFRVRLINGFEYVSRRPIVRTVTHTGRICF